MFNLSRKKRKEEKIIKLSSIPFKTGDKFTIKLADSKINDAIITRKKRNNNVILKIPKLSIESLEINPNKLNVIE